MRVHLGLGAGFLLVGSIFSYGTTNAVPARPGWQLVWADEFDGPDKSAPNPAKWKQEQGGNGWGNKELETYTTRPENVRVEGGQLVIEARQENYTGKDGKMRPYTSARLKTHQLASWAYGRIEARIQIPRGQGIWPAFWMMGENIDTAGWPGGGEIDIMENIGKEPGTVHGTIHGPGYSGAGGIGHPYKLPDGKALADDYHLYAVEWVTNAITWLVDDHAYATIKASDLPAGKKWVYDHPHFILLNLAVGGYWPGNPDATTQFPQKMKVDYVRVWQRSEAAGKKGI
ncbi:MAG TPA: glycoside hydrolase family 16 protein [Candidatus Limnocylindria bacterium]|jgi:beta-glucanase (GH16 family)|nr:glycoside hydrolase family 16 protein [Candidatus Limnocylindria bacterium]